MEEGVADSGIARVAEDKAKGTHMMSGMRWLNRRFHGLEGGHGEVRKTGDGLGTLDTEEMNGPRLRPMTH